MLIIGRGKEPGGRPATAVAKLVDKVELAVVHIDCRDVQSHRPGLLDGHVPETADARDHDPVTRSGPRPAFDELSGDRSAEKGRPISGVLATADC